MRELLARNGHELLDLIESKEIDHFELLQAQLDFARSVDDKLGAFITWHEEAKVLRPSLAVDIEGLRPRRDVVPGGGPRRFNRLPYAAKDIFATEGIASTAGSRMLEDYRPAYNATCIEHLKQEKNHLLGKTNMDEFAMGSSGETSAYNTTRNPWSTEHVPGGSSSGSAAAVAACQCVMALGTDTGGSIRQPASFCGIVGYKPTYGMLSRYGMIAYSSSCDQAGIFARSAQDVALVMNTIARPDGLDSTCRTPQGVDYYAEAQREVHWKKLRLGVLKPFTDPQRIDAPVLDNFNAALERMAGAGAEVVELDFPLADYCLPAYYIITAAECSSNLARYDGIRYGKRSAKDELMQRYLEVRSEGFGPEVKRRILLGAYVLSAGYYDAYYDRARRVRRDIRAALDKMFTKVDIIATPTSPTLPFKFGERLEDPVAMYMSDLCTVFVNLAGSAGISLPSGFGEADGVKLPTGLQLVCAPFRDSLLLRVACQYELLSDWRFKPPGWIAGALGN
ncbi:Asp-tRNA(Asn)/Glu-tRNA(Gln) amidotransferase subunit GatA [bacterium]|nr:Asp-tRNA(Asn)/Glu-tRNA(Gln) amidotransferase subunit GatA [bacterium]